MTIHFDKRQVHEDLTHPHGPTVLPASMQRAVEHKRLAQADVPWETLRDQAHAVKAFAVAHLGELLVEFEKQFEARGGAVLWARTADEAASHFINICRRHGATSVVKGKSMVSEELELNARLAAEGIEPIETDLGEYIVQLAGQRPSHIIGPALHMSAEEIGDLFARRLKMEKTVDAAALSEAARVRIRERYLEAGVGMTGANFAIAQTGTVVVVENEGNGGLSAQAPPVHVIVAGIEKVIPRLEDLPVFLHLLARSATGQKLSTYTHHFLGPQEGRTAYCILVDAGRTQVLADPETRESLYCIRCGACLNVCPIYRRVGGWAYGWVYPGPIGSVLTPQMVGVEDGGELPFASTLCGACGEECPTKIDLPHQLVHMRRRAVDAGASSSPLDGLALRAWSAAMESPGAYRAAIAAARVGGAIVGTGPWAPNAVKQWGKTRKAPAIARETFKEWWSRR
jgi:L-lactate dehydrogenase complex protein LldF